MRLRLALFATTLSLAGCQTQRMDIQPSGPAPTELTVIDVEVRGRGGRVELVKRNVRRRAPISGLDASGRGVGQWVRGNLNQQQLVEFADLQAGQAGWDIAYNVLLPSCPMRLEIRFDGETIWEGPIGTRWGGEPRSACR